MIEQDQDAHQYDYTKQIQQLKRVWKSYNNAPAEQDYRKSPRNDKNDSKSKVKSNKDINVKQKKDKLKDTKQSQPILKQTLYSSKNKPQQQIPKQSPRSPKGVEEIHIQTRVNQNKLKSVQLGLGENYNEPYAETKYRNSVRHNEDVSDEYLRSELDEKNKEIALLRIAGNRYHDKITHLEREIEKRDELIAQLRHENRKREKQGNKGVQKQWLIDYGQAEYQSLKRDVKRLLKMLKNTQQYKTFATLALDDGSVRCLHQANKTNKTNIDVKQPNMHFCTCNKAFISEPGLWVPENIYKFTKEFVKTRNGELTNGQLELMMYDLNKLWREREKTIINSINGIKAQELGVLRRKIQNLTHNNKKQSG